MPFPWTHAGKENKSTDKYTSMKLSFLLSLFLIRYFRPLTSGLLAAHSSCVLLRERREFWKVGQLPPCEPDPWHFFTELTSNLFTKQRCTTCVYVCFKPVGLMLKIWHLDCGAEWVGRSNVLRLKRSWRTWRCREAPVNFGPDMLPATPPKAGERGLVKSWHKPLFPLQERNSSSFHQHFKWPQKLRRRNVSPKVILSLQKLPAKHKTN